MVRVNSFFSSAFAPKALDRLFQALPRNGQTETLQRMARRIGADIPKAGGFESLDLRAGGSRSDAIVRLQKSISVLDTVLGYKARAEEQTTYASGLTVTRSEAHIKKVREGLSSSYELDIGGTQLSDQFRIFSSGPRQVGADAGGGNDTVFVVAKSANGIDSGQGGDHIQVNADAVSGIYGRGDADSVMVLAQTVSGVHGGAGRDTISIMAQTVSGIYGDNAQGESASPLDQALAALPGQADDAVTISARTVNAVDAGAGNDMLSIRASQSIDGVDGGAGNDAISIIAGEARSISGGAGDDRMIINARKAEAIRGGTGDDTITLLNTEEASVHFAKGDGRDMVSISGTTTITLGEGLSAEAATILREGSAIKIAFPGSADKITVFHGFADFGDTGPNVEIVSGNSIRIG